MIYITGDTHIPIDIHKLSSKRFPVQKELTKDDFVIICGDFGGVWNNGNEELYWRKWFEKKHFTTLFVDGNHENFDLLREFPIVDFRGGKAHQISQTIFHLMRGQVYQFEGKRVFTLGGASSHDKQYRKEGKNWWKQELPTKEEYNTAFEKLSKNFWSVDYIISHCAPTSVQCELTDAYEKNELTDFLESLKSKVSYRQWFFGHYHVDRDIDEKHIAVFDRVLKL